MNRDLGHLITIPFQCFPLQEKEIKDIKKQRKEKIIQINMVKINEPSNNDHKYFINIFYLRWDLFLLHFNVLIC